MRTNEPLPVTEDVAMECPRMKHPEAWIAVLRVVAGAWFLKAVWTKLTIAWLAEVIPYPAVTPRFYAVHARRVSEFADGNPIGWYREFLRDVVLPHAPTFATLQAYGEAAVGVGLVLGAGTALAALLGLVLSLNFGLATQWMSVGQQGFHVMLVTAMVVLLAARAGRVWGVDRLLVARWPGLRTVA